MTPRRDDNEGPQDAPGADEAGSRFAALSDAQLVAALRRGELDVLDEFVVRFQRVLMGQARHFGIPSDERRTWATEVLYDVALQIGKPNARVPEHLRAYILTIAHHKLVSERRADRRWGQQEDAIDAPPRPLDEQGLEGGCPSTRDARAERSATKVCPSRRWSSGWSTWSRRG